MAFLEQTTGERSGIFSSDIIDSSDMGSTFHSNGIYNRKDMQWYTKFNRFGCLDPFNGLGTTREYLFFTRPDLHIFTPGTSNLNPQLANNEFFVEFVARYPDVARQLQRSSGAITDGDRYPFINLLSNSVKNTLDLPEVNADDIETATNTYGTTITYRGNGYASDEAFDFSLEFEDTRYLELYHLFKAWDLYKQLDSVGVVSPPNINGAPEDENGLSYNRYLEYKELNDQIGIYKIIVDEDFETILYYAYMIGYPKSVPRESFSELQTGNGLRYSIQWRAQFVTDMKPRILIQLNNIVHDMMGDNGYVLNLYDSENHRVVGEWATAPWIVRSYKNTYNQWLAPNSMQYTYKLKWRLL